MALLPHMKLVSSKYKGVLNDTHSLTKNEWGGGHSIDKLPKYAGLLKSLDVKTILDYGCANGKFKPYMNTTLVLEVKIVLLFLLTSLFVVTLWSTLNLNF